jgi:squalene-hopene/tetraprenyl-beta-curcumene cyclase
MRTAHLLVVVLGVMVFTGVARAETNAAIATSAVQAPKYDPNEPVAPRVSLANGAAYLDNLAAFWMQEKKVPKSSTRLTSCGSCHANFSYLMARPLLLKEFSKSQVDETRRFMDDRLTRGFDRLRRDKPGIGPICTENGGFVGYSALEFVSSAAALTFLDAQTTGKLHPTTRNALKRMWMLQNDDGSWNVLEHCASMSFPVPEFDPYYGATLAALATGIAPEDYAGTSEAKAGLTKLRKYFMNHRPPSTHHQAMLLWASLRVEGLMTKAERDDTIDALLKLQRRDGGWSTSILAKEVQRRNRFTDPNSDGYGTGFAVYVLRQAGTPASSPEIVRGVNWLKTHQRVSGNWHTTHALGNDDPEGGLGKRGFSVTALATAFAIMAIKSCETAEARNEAP